MKHKTNSPTLLHCDILDFIILQILRINITFSLRIFLHYVFLAYVNFHHHLFNMASGLFLK